MNKIVKNTLILTLITVIAGFLLGAVYEITKDPIAQSQEKTKKEAWQAVFSDVKLDDFKAEDVDQKAASKAVKDMGTNATVDEVCTAGDEGYVITTTDKDGKTQRIAPISYTKRCLLAMASCLQSVLFERVLGFRKMFARPKCFV